MKLIYISTLAFLLFGVMPRMQAGEPKPNPLAQMTAERDHWRAIAANNANVASHTTHVLEQIKLIKAIEESQQLVIETKAALCPGQQLDEKKYQQGVIACLDKETKPDTMKEKR